MKWALRLAPLALTLVSPVVLFVLLIGFVVVLVQQDEQPPAGCGSGSPGVSVAGIPAGAVAGYSGTQLEIAATIMQAGLDAGVSQHGQTLGVAMAMGESTLTNVRHGDRVGPDSTGIAQQRDPWGSRPEREDPYTAATFFFTGGSTVPDGYEEPGLLDIPGWETLAPTVAIHRVQRNADPYHYEKYWVPAQEVVAALSGAAVTVLPVAASAPVAGAVPCQNGPVVAGGQLPAGSWTRPAVGRFTSPFGPRGGVPHNGVDIANACGTAIGSAADGVVIGVHTNNRPPATGYGTLVVVDHGGGVLTRYAHAANEDVLVTVGQQVTAGQQLTRMGTYGQSTGCHLHFEVQETQGGAVRFIDPEPFMRDRGVELRAGV